ncbi:hypothetical protein [Deinococcus hopiensis]|nr:hypothetical protein [Deinococcus hopiensis]
MRNSQAHRHPPDAAAGCRCELGMADLLLTLLYRTLSSSQQ